MVLSLAQQDMASPGTAQSQVVAQSSIDPTAQQAFHTMKNPSPSRDVWMQQQASTIPQRNFQPKPMLAPWYQPHEATEQSFTDQTATTTRQNSTSQPSQSIQPTSTIQPTLSQPMQQLMQPTGQMEVSDMSQTTFATTINMTTFDSLTNQDSIMDTSESSMDLNVFASLGIQVNFGKGSKQISPPDGGALCKNMSPKMTSDNINLMPKNQGLFLIFFIYRGDIKTIWGRI